MLSAFQMKNKKKESFQTSIQSLDNIGSSEHLNTEDSDKKENDEESLPTRFVPGGGIPKAQGKKMRRHLIGFLLMLVVQVGIPLALYYGLRNTIGVVYALVISGIPPVLWVIVNFIRKRKIDALGCIISLSFILSGVISIVTGDARAALIRDSAVGAVIGGFFLVTLIPINTQWLVLRPLTYIIGEQMMGGMQYEWTDRDGNLQQQSVVAWQFDHIRFFRWSMRLQTLAWGVFLVLELVACVLFVETTDLPTDDIVKYNNIINAVVISVMTTVSIIASLYGRKFVIEFGKEWTKENDFTEKFERQRKEQEQEEGQQYHQDDNRYTTIQAENIV
ncbi:hypothetical protein INT45_006146 [Circinella minor]|uniref:Uncharacterized protein n=1 Tax=Circinella minor TaxID=1195481 RepID=A0A8H7VKS5_9FUNG|nr:hypothetical protein INT45_006146 [Circinella minor]